MDDTAFADWCPLIGAPCLGDPDDKCLIGACEWISRGRDTHGAGSPTEGASEFHVLHEAAERLEYYLDTYELSTAARIAGHQLADELRKIAGPNDRGA